ncbi:glycosyltransferase family 2 protein [Vibrio sp. SM6]|uniref:Glycosyltransferase family 2 protein n=1 Tax=Vibrio agarilyticus TaxID=2726741 RepID=A0A7X8TRH4_9VIBR|nr:glycosyltransferase family 2 protein [Vibrio agarilyticus]NLS13440.1 glycosyltransferase family 2 protein [Vibrio agarilyticus]
MAKVSVIIPTHNCIDYLPKSVMSVLNQSHRDLELIIVNDNSCDGSENYLQSLHDPRVRVMTTHVASAAKARNLGLSQARGDYVAFLDADDAWYPLKLSKQLALHRRFANAALSFTNYDHVDESDAMIIDSFAYWGQFLHGEDALIQSDSALSLLITTNMIGTSTVMINRKVLKQTLAFDDTIDYGEDWDLWLKIAENHPIAVLNQCQTRYLMRQDSLTQSDHRRLTNLQSIESIFARYSKSNPTITRRALTQGRARILEGYADYYRQSRHFGKALWHGLHALGLDVQPRRIRSVIGDCRRALKLAR